MSLPSKRIRDVSAFFGVALAASAITGAQAQVTRSGDATTATKPSQNITITNSGDEGYIKAKKQRPETTITVTAVRADPNSILGKNVRLDDNGNCHIPQLSTHWMNPIRDFLLVLSKPVEAAREKRYNQETANAPETFKLGAILSLTKTGEYVDSNVILNCDTAQKEIGYSAENIKFQQTPADPTYYNIVGNSGLARQCMVLAGK
jgi:hypothetical protein